VSEIGYAVLEFSCGIVTKIPVTFWKNFLHIFLLFSK